MCPTVKSAEHTGQEFRHASQSPRCRRDGRATKTLVTSLLMEKPGISGVLKGVWGRARNSSASLKMLRLVKQINGSILRQGSNSAIGSIRVLQKFRF